MNSLFGPVKIVKARNFLLELLGRTLLSKKYLEEANSKIAHWTGSRYVGMRILESDGKIPHGASLGFKRKFWLSENFLSIKRDRCVCTRIITGKILPQDRIVMTNGGSFYSNNTIEFLAKIPEEEKSEFRGMCMLSGFLSLAVIPIRYNKKIMGVIYLADRKKNHFSPDKIKFLENIAPIIGVAISKFNYQEKLRLSEKKYRELVENASSIILRLDAKGRITYFNEFAQKFFGYKEREIIGKLAVETIIPKRDTAGADLEEMMRRIYKHPNRYIRNENENVCKSGKKVWISWNNKAILGRDGKIEELLCVGNDITDKRRDKIAMAKLNRELRMISECNRAHDTHER